MTFTELLQAEIDKAEAEIVFEIGAFYADWMNDRLELAGLK